MTKRPVIKAGLVLGVGLGGFIDGIVLHQILQWHSMLSSVIPPTDLVAMKANMLWDGMFHLLTWTVTLIGVVMLAKAAHLCKGEVPNRMLAGSMLAGWGMFNLVEGTLNHLVLAIHHVRPGESHLVWDVAFVTIGGIGLILVGYLLLAPHASPMLRPWTRSSSPAH